MMPERVNSDGEWILFLDWCPSNDAGTYCLLRDCSGQPIQRFEGPWSGPAGNGTIWQTSTSI